MNKATGFLLVVSGSLAAMLAGALFYIKQLEERLETVAAAQETQNADAAEAKAQEDSAEVQLDETDEKAVRAFQKEVAASRQRAKERLKDRALVKMDLAAQAGWYDNFEQKLDEARKTHRALVLFYTHENCPHCKRLEVAVDEDSFAQWAAKSNVIVCRVRGIANDEEQDEARDFAKSAPNKLKMYPYVSVYRLNADGSELRENFTGRRGKMPVEGPASSTLTEVVIASIEKILAP